MILLLLLSVDRSEELIQYYQHADRNGDTYLTLEGVMAFQRKMYEDFEYITNDVALPPEQFLRNNGGDCEDWAIFTVDMLDYYDYEAYVGIVQGSGGGNLHAIALIYAPYVPDKDILLYMYLTYPGISSGYYLPVDYQYVGGLSTATYIWTDVYNIYSHFDLYWRDM